jgi:CRP-like cAMP-binding protein
MEIINDKALLNRFLKEHHIDAFFSSCQPRFTLLRYWPGEMLTTPFAPSQYLQFIIRGELLLYDMPTENSTVSLQTSHQEIRMIGDMELLDVDFVPFFVEAKSKVITAALYLEQYRERLLSDPVFLLHLCRCLANKLNGAVVSSRSGSLRQRVCMSLQNAQCGDAISNIARLARSLNVSPRQLLRVLKELCGEGYLEHPGKGIYIVRKKPDLTYDDVRRKE